MKKHKKRERKFQPLKVTIAELLPETAKRLGFAEAEADKR